MWYTLTMETPPKPEPAGQDAKVPTSYYPALDPTLPYSLLDSAGKFADDPYWDVMMDSIRRHRREMDAAWDNVE